MPATLEGIFVHPETFEQVCTQTFDDEFCTVLNRQAQSEPDAAYRAWAKTIEECWSETLRTAPQQNAQEDSRNMQDLPAGFRGRGKVPKLVSRQMPSHVGCAPKGGYNPPTDAQPIPLRRVVKQVRRLQLLLARMIKWEKFHGSYHDEQPWTDEMFSASLQMQSEWAAILAAKGFEPDFSIWLASPDRLGFRFLQLPTSGGLQVLLDIVKKHVDALARQVKTQRLKDFRMKINIDMTQGSGKFTFKILKPAKTQPLEALQTTEIFHLKRTRLSGKQRMVFHWDEDRKLEPTFPLKVHDTFFRFHQQGTRLTLEPLGEITAETQEELRKAIVQVKQTCWITEPAVIAEQTSQYWCQFWQRDQYTLDDDYNLVDDQHGDFPPLNDALHIIDQYLPLWDTCDVVITPEHWRQAVKSLPSHAAKGCDGFVKDELLMLPFCVWESLNGLFDNMAHWPKCLLFCKTHMLPKTEKPSHPSLTRPITVASIIYRCWASTVARQMLQHWSSRLPGTISGGIPGKGTSHILMQIYNRLEQAWVDGKQVSGCVLDIIKAFNAVPRVVAWRALQRLGFPLRILNLWKKALVGLRRFVNICNTSTDALPSSTGLPEGDACSILGMLSLTYAWSLYVQDPEVFTFGYADNLEWLASDPDRHDDTMGRTLHFLHVMRLQLATDKTFVWATSKQHEKVWERVWGLHFPRIPIQLRHDSTDLGCEFHYGKKAAHTVLPKRFDDAMQKAKKMQSLPCDLEVKCALVRRSVLPTALYGTEFSKRRISYSHNCVVLSPRRSLVIFDKHLHGWCVICLILIRRLHGFGW